MVDRLCAVIGLVMFASYLLYISFAIRTGAGPLIVIALLVTALVALDAWREGFRRRDGPS
ncbi:MAG TPA: hypothetical protein VFG43_06695 [Geminicoccaceae bacterium]|nr:hypothetical protein [Geminicoccaceae bacterium]